MKREEVIKTINQFLVEDFEIDEALLVPEKNIVEDLKIDSLDIVDIIVRVNEVFGVKLDKMDLINVHTLGDFYDLIAERVK
ncbi:MAG: phosphopantetheine-binding protein [Paludibacteraceae bacterium]|nr:phosphopantetheine-binding protein [Paludibacteraceae bacterium]